MTTQQLEALVKDDLLPMDVIVMLDRELRGDLSPSEYMQYQLAATVGPFVILFHRGFELCN